MPAPDDEDKILKLKGFAPRFAEQCPGCLGASCRNYPNKDNAGGHKMNCQKRRGKTWANRPERWAWQDRLPVAALGDVAMQKKPVTVVLIGKL